MRMKVPSKMHITQNSIHFVVSVVVSVCLSVCVFVRALQAEQFDLGFWHGGGHLDLCQVGIVRSRSQVKGQIPKSCFYITITLLLRDGIKSSENFFILNQFKIARSPPPPSPAILNLNFLHEGHQQQIQNCIYIITQYMKIALQKSVIKRPLLLIQLLLFWSFRIETCMVVRRVQMSV